MNARPRVLIVDDEPAIRLALRLLLRMSGYETVEAADGASALQVFHQAAPDLVLLDLMLPDQTGVDVLRQIPAEARARTPIIIISAIADSEFQAHAFALGAAARVLKPFCNETILDVLAHCLGDPAEARARPEHEEIRFAND